MPRAKKQAKKFTAFLKESLTGKKYEELCQRTGISAHRLTKIQNDPTTARLQEIRELAAYLGILSATLIIDHKLGRATITLEEMELLEAEALNFKE